MSSADKIDAITPEVTHETARKPLQVLAIVLKLVEDARLPVNFIKNIMDFPGTISTIVKRALPATATASQHAADITKSITAVSSAFQVIAFCVKMAVMVDEARRGKEQFPILGNLVVRLQRELSKSMQVFLRLPSPFYPS